MAGDDKHARLQEYYPSAVSIECEGGTVTLVDAEGVTRAGYCPVCERGKLLSAIESFTPPRFRQPVDLPVIVAEWAARGKKAEGLYLTGPVGTGKTHMAWSALAAWCGASDIKPHHGGIDRSYDTWTEDREYGPSVIFTRMTDLLDDLRPGDDSRKRIRHCQDASMLVLDDMGAEKASEWTQERIYSIVDERYVHQLPLIVTSNLPPKELAGQTGERTASRLAEMCVVVPITGTDRRKPAK